MSSAKGWIDISVPLRAGMLHWPGDPEVRIDPVCSISGGSGCNVTAVAMSAHTGTHIDAPLHYIDGATGIDALPFEAVVGPARVVAFRERRPITPGDIVTLHFSHGDRILFRTPNSETVWRRAGFDPDYVFLSPAGARLLADIGVQTVGIDGLSIGGPGPEGDEAHLTLLQAGVWIIEGLDLSGVAPGLYEMVCLPLRLSAEGAPARAIVRRIAAQA